MGHGNGLACATRLLRGYHRVTAGEAPRGVAISAYVDPIGNALAIVAIDNNASATDVPV